jgi:hypothetical protein
MMNDKAFCLAKIRNSLKNMLGQPYLSGHELSRLTVLATMVCGILMKKSCRLPEIAAANCRDIQQPSKEKQIKRWLLNKHTSYLYHYLPYISELLRSLAESGKLVLSIDGSVAGRGCMVLMLSVIVRKRAIPVIWRVYKAKKGHLPEQAHRELLAELAPLIPAGTSVIIVGDGEYDGCDWQADIRALGWYYVLRTAKNSLVETEPGEIISIGSMSPEASQPYFMLYDLRFSAKKYGPVNLLIQEHPQYKEPLYLITTLEFPPQIAQYYQQRFKIETFFSDQKSRGFNLHRSHLSDPKRLEKLLIASCLAYIFCLLAGEMAVNSLFYSRIHRPDRCDLSRFALGLRFIHWLVEQRQWRPFRLVMKIE